MHYEYQLKVPIPSLILLEEGIDEAEEAHWKQVCWGGRNLSVEFQNQQRFLEQKASKSKENS